MTRVLMVDDSPAMRRLLASRIRNDADLEVVGMAGDPYEARDLIGKLHPDVLTLDIEMPRMNGLEFLSRLMRHHPIPSVVVSTLAGPRTAAAVQALQLGAVAALSKDEARQPGVLAKAIRLASRANISVLRNGARDQTRIAKAERQVAKQASAKRPAAISGSAQVDLLAIGISTGGPQALAKVFADLPAGLPPIVLVQHMPPDFTKALAARLNKLSAVNVMEAEHGRVLAAGTAVIAPGARHLKVRKRGSQIVTELSDDAPVQYHRPSVDVLFQSIARSGLKTAAIVMTGMGRDGADGLLALRRAGAVTMAQDQATSLVYGMPQEAAKNGAAAHAVPLGRIAEALTRAAMGGQKVRPTG